MSKVAVLSEEELIELIKIAAMEIVLELRDEFYRPLPGLMNIKQLSDYLQCSDPTVRNCIKKKGLPIHYLNALPRFYKAEVDDWLRKSDHQKRKGKNG